MRIRRCHHVKVNGEQCGSPALRGKCYCYFHNNYHHLGAYGAKQNAARNPFKDRFPVLEDGNSIQAAVMQVMRLILAKEIDAKEAGLLLYALQIASSNLSHFHVAPWYDEIVIDPLLVRYSRVGGKTAREENFKIETEEDQKERDELEQRIEQSQEQANAEWEEETRREFEPPANSATEDAKQEAVTEADASTPPRRPPTPAHEQAVKLFEAGAALSQHPGDPEYIRAYQAAWAEAGEANKKSSNT